MVVNKLLTKGGQKVGEGVGHPDNKTSFVGFVFIARGGSPPITEATSACACVCSGANNRGGEGCDYIYVCACACEGLGERARGRGAPRVLCMGVC